MGIELMPLDAPGQATRRQPGDREIFYTRHQTLRHSAIVVEIGDFVIVCRS